MAKSETTNLAVGLYDFTILTGIIFWCAVVSVRSIAEQRRVDRVEQSL